MRSIRDTASSEPKSSLPKHQSRFCGRRSCGHTRTQVQTQQLTLHGQGQSCSACAQRGLGGTDFRLCQRHDRGWSWGRSGSRKDIRIMSAWGSRTHRTGSSTLSQSQPMTHSTMSPEFFLMIILPGGNSSFKAHLRHPHASLPVPSQCGQGHVTMCVQDIWICVCTRNARSRSKMHARLIH